jgi:hypothetical protein
MSQEGDLVLIHYQKEPAIFGRIEAIEPDVKKDWYQVTLLLLTIPPHKVTWILRREYIDGAEFTMGGIPMTLQPVPRSFRRDSGGQGESSGPKGTKIIPFRKP